nr:hypothetical protein [Tanacetum cinerariifolium]
MKIQAGIQVSRPRDLKRQLQLWKHFGRLHLIIFVLVRNIRDVMKTNRNDIIWLMASMGSSPYLNSKTVRPKSSKGNSEVLMIDRLSIVETDKVNHTVEIDIVKLVVEIKSSGMSADELDKETGSFDGLKPKQAVLSCVVALNEPHLHEIHVVQSTHEAD